MQPAFFEYAPTARWHRRLSTNFHIQRLSEINSRRVALDEPVTRKILPKIKKDIQEVFRDRKNAILQENKRFIKKLDEVDKSQRTSHKHRQSFQFSLNFSARKQDFIRIIKENELMLNKIYTVSSEYSQRSMHKDYRRSNRYKKNISKMKWLSLEPRRPFNPNICSRNLITRSTRGKITSTDEGVFPKDLSKNI